MRVGIGPPMSGRVLHYRQNASILLVDQNRGAPIADGLAQRQNEPAHLFAICDVPGEKNEAPGLGVVKERPLSFGELRSGASIDCPVPRGHFTDRYSWLCGEAGSPACLQLCAKRIGGGGTGEGANPQTKPCAFSRQLCLLDIRLEISCGGVT